MSGCRQPGVLRVYISESNLRTCHDNAQPSLWFKQTGLGNRPSALSAQVSQTRAREDEGSVSDRSFDCPREAFSPLSGFAARFAEASSLRFRSVRPDASLAAPTSAAKAAIAVIATSRQAMTFMRPGEGDRRDGVWILITVFNMAYFCVELGHLRRKHNSGFSFAR